MIVEETGEVEQSTEDIPRNTCFKIPSRTCCTIQVNLSK